MLDYAISLEDCFNTVRAWCFLCKTNIHKTQGSKDIFKYFKENQRHEDVVRTDQHVGIDNSGFIAGTGILAVPMAWREEATLVESLSIP